ncbi:Aspartic proteinase CDR1 [Linum perenne]
MVLLCFIANSEAAAGGGFSVQLIHRDSPVSPFYNPHLSPSQRLGNALKRSVNRLHHFSSTTTNSILSAQSQVTPDNGEYLMNISLGTPPVQILAIADTGSDNICTQCKPCTNCFVQNAPLFNPASSSTYKTVSCSSKVCSSCEDVVSTPLFSVSEIPAYYILQLDGVSVGEKRIPYQESGVSFGGKGNIMIDSGSALTWFSQKFFSQLTKAIDSQIVGGKKAEDPNGYLSHCYLAPAGSSGSSLKVPRITVHFQGANVELPPSNVFIQVSDTMTCLAFQGSDNGSIYGNVAQQNFLIGYDIQKRTVSFKPTDCAHNN